MSKISFISDVDGIRVDKYISEKLEDYSRSFIKKLIDDYKVRVNGNIVKTNFKVRLNDVIEIDIYNPKKLEIVPQNIKIDVIYEDDDIIVVNKPKNMVVHPAPGNDAGTLVNALLAHCNGKLSDLGGDMRQGIVHRIDKDTTGVLVIAKNNDAHYKLSKLFCAHDINRKYIAIVYGVIKNDRGTIDAPIGRHPIDRKRMAINLKNGKNAVTHFKVLERFLDSTLIEVTLETGRTHQIRVHMSSIGFPIVGDLIYGRKKDKYGLDSQVLHAKMLGLVHPRTGEYVEFDSKLPEYFDNLIKKLRNEK